MSDEARGEAPPDVSLTSLLKLEQAVAAASPPHGPSVSPDNSPDKSDHESRLRFILRELQQYPAASGSPAATGRTVALPESLPPSIGKYEIVELLGSGGFAMVFRGWDETLQRTAAIKIPLPHRWTDAQLRRRFVREARAAAQLDHPHIVATWETGEDGAIPFIASAYCEGPSLARRLLTEGPLRADQAAQLVSQLADAVAYSHSRGILHRDIKPANILLFPKGPVDDDEFPFTPRLTDFGLAKLVEQAAVESGSSVIMGTPMYLAPEQLEMPGVDHGFASDVFGLGTVLYESLTGRPPFQGRTIPEVLEAVRAGAMDFSDRLFGATPPDLIAICRRALAHDPRDRYPTAVDLRSDLERFLKGEPVRARPVGWLRRFDRWASQPARIAEAAAFDALTHTALLLWVVSWAVFAVPQRMSFRDSWVFLVPVVAVHAVMVWLSGWMLRGRWSAAVVLSLNAGATVAVQLATLGGWTEPPFPSLFGSQQEVSLFYRLSLLIFACQLVMSACALRAIAIRTARRRAVQAANVLLDDDPPADGTTQTVQRL